MSEEHQVNYASYLKLGKGYEGEKVTGLLDCVTMLSDNEEEHLFISTHQAFEIWFKQILFDFERMKTLLNISINNYMNVQVRKKCQGQIPKLLNRCRDLFRLMLNYFPILETMSQLSFHNFRKYLAGGSGFQSFQFRMIENTFGLIESNRRNPQGYKDSFQGDELKKLEEAQTDTWNDILQKWLEHILDEYNKNHPDQTFQQLLKMSTENKAKARVNDIKILFDEKTFENEHINAAKEKQISYFGYKAFLGALVLHQFQEEPEYQIPYNIIALTLDLDEAIMNWRARHINMVHRFIGGRAGTGGTSGYSYLSTTLNDRYKVFYDLFNMATYILPSECLTE